MTPSDLKHSYRPDVIVVGSRECRSLCRDLSGMRSGARRCLLRWFLRHSISAAANSHYTGGAFRFAY